MARAVVYTYNRQYVAEVGNGERAALVGWDSDTRHAIL